MSSSDPADSVLDSILAAAEALTTVSAPVPSPPQGDYSPLMRHIPRRGGYDKGTVPNCFLVSSTLTVPISTLIVLVSSGTEARFASKRIVL